MKKFSLCLVALITFSFASQLLAITDEEIFRAFSLNLSTPGARARGMGGAFIGRADDATAAQTNPAGLTLLVRPEIAAEYRFVNSRSVATNIVQIPVTNFDSTPSPIVNPDPSGDLDPTQAEFHASDNRQHVNELGFFSVVYPLNVLTVAFSRHELINTDASVQGAVSSSPFHFVEPNDFKGEVAISHVNYGFSAAIELGDEFSIGGTIKIADFNFDSIVGARQKSQTQFGQHFISTINTDDTQVGFNVGVLWRMNPKISIGGVYRYEPEFELDTRVQNADRTVGGHPAPTDVIREIGFDVPDTLGLGISISPTPQWNFNLDLNRVFHSQLEDVETQFSLFTHLLPPAPSNAGDITFGIDDGTDIHVGAEYLIIGDRNTTAVRFGVYRETRNRFFLARAANSEIADFLDPIFGSEKSNDIAHLTFGTGFTAGQFQLDAAIDLARKDDIDEDNKQEISDGGFDLILSAVYRF